MSFDARLETTLAELMPATVVVRAGSVAALGDHPLLPGESDAVARAIERRRREFAAGRACARAALESLGQAAAGLPPDADRVPRWPAGTVGCISHTGPWVAAVAARLDRVGALGIDLEETGPLERPVGRRICTPDELAGVERLPGGDASTCARLAFSAKEAFYKAYFPRARTRLDFLDVRIELDPVRRRMQAELVREDAPSLLGLRRLPVRFALLDELICCVAVVAAG